MEKPALTGAASSIVLAGTVALLVLRWVLSRRKQVAALPEALRGLATDHRDVVEPSRELVSLRRSLAARAEATEVLAYRR